MIRGSPLPFRFFDFMVIKCGSRQPLSFSNFQHFMVNKCGSRQPLSSHIPTNLMKQRVVRGSPFYVLISTNLIIAKGDSRAAPSLLISSILWKFKVALDSPLIPMFSPFYGSKDGSRHLLFFPQSYKINGS